VSQTLLKLTTPGVPDIYQGNDLLDFSLVDPDNRRAIDYGKRQQAFESIRKWSANPDATSVSRLLETPEDGRLKLYLIWKTLCLRKQWPDLFQQGEYVPLSVYGARANHVVAFMRKSGQASVLVVVPRLIANLLPDSNLPPTGPTVWEDTHIVVPTRGSSEKYLNVLTGESVDFSRADAKIAIAELLAHFPAALCVVGEMSAPL
jgi:(1->4)-alpha-D-glucan 1-alpha-D-glucosylmutase